MNDFKTQVALLRALTDVSSGQVDGDDGKRYLAGFVFGLGVAEEGDQFEPWPAEVPGIFVQDPFLRGVFDGRAGDTRQWLMARCQK